MPRPYLLGVDLGTTTCRCALFDRDGREIAAVYRETPVRYPRPLWAEVDPEDWWRSTVRVIREVLATSRVSARQIASVGLSGLMHAPVLLDAVGQPVAPAMLWMDQRCAPQSDAMRREAEELGVRVGIGLGTGVTAPKLRWLAEAHPELMARVSVVLLPKDFLRYRLTGTIGTDASDASGTGMFDREAGAWRPEIVRLAGIGREHLPTVQPGWERAGAVAEGAADETGLIAGTPVAVGGADTLCTRVGVGPLATGQICMYLGTAAWISVFEGVGPDGRQIMRSFGATSTTGAVLRWLRDLLVGPAEDDLAGSYDSLTRLAVDVSPGAEGLMMLPHLMGERGPQPDPLARGAFVGLTLRHQRPHFVRAALEGTAFQIRRLLDSRIAGYDQGIPENRRAVACGGAARSTLWLRVLADVTRLSLRVPAVVEAGALGAAMLGGVAAGLFALDEAQAQMVHLGGTLEPNAAAATEYDALYRRYCQVDDLLAPWYREGQ